MSHAYLTIIVLIVICCSLANVEAVSKRVNGGWSRWSRWGRCSKTCAGGIQIRRRTCTNPRPSGGGRQCPGASLQIRSCPCKQVNGGWSDYGRWSPCSKTCGGGTSTQTRSCTRPRPSCCGAKCRGSSRKTRRCNTQSCNTRAAFAKSIMKADSTNTRRCNARPTTCPARQVCPKTCVNFCYYHARDFLIILDSSGSITVPEYEEAKVDLAIIATHLCGHIGCDLRVAGMHFSTNTHFAFGFDEHTSSPALYSAIIGMGKEHLGTNTHLAFNFARLTMFTIANGHRPCAKKVALIVTDGKSANGTAAIYAAQNLKNSGVELFAVYIGNPGDVDYAEIIQYVSHPEWLHVFSVTSVLELGILADYIESFHHMFCHCHCNCHDDCL